jgi:hypothetical protein
LCPVTDVRQELRREKQRMKIVTGGSLSKWERLCILKKRERYHKHYIPQDTVLSAAIKCSNLLSYCESQACVVRRKLNAIAQKRGARCTLRSINRTSYACRSTRTNQTSKRQPISNPQCP